MIPFLAPLNIFSPIPAGIYLDESCAQPAAMDGLTQLVAAHPSTLPLGLAHGGLSGVSCYGPPLQQGWAGPRATTADEAAARAGLAAQVPFC